LFATTPFDHVGAMVARMRVAANGRWLPGQVTVSHAVGTLPETQAIANLVQTADVQAARHRAYQDFVADLARIRDLAAARPARPPVSAQT